MTRPLYWYPISLSAIGVGIHFFGTLRLFQLEVPRSIHAIMFFIDLLVVVGLIQQDYGVTGWRLFYIFNNLSCSLIGRIRHMRMVMACFSS